jgi:predicted DNA-binding transcriptional regulator AlpA
VPEIALVDSPLVPETLVTLQQVAKAVGIGDRSIMRWVEEGKFPQPIRIGGPVRPRIRFKLADVQRFLAERGAAQ